MLRPGTNYTGYGTNSNNKAIHLPFVFANNDTAIIELTDSIMRIKVAEIPISRPAVSTTIANGTFNSNLTGWTNADESGATSAWQTGGYMSLTGTTFNAAKQRQTLTIAGGDQNVEHAFRIVVNLGSVTLRVGSTLGDDNYINETLLGTGTHSLGFIPTGGSVFVEFSNLNDIQVLVDSIAIESAGIMTLPTPWTATSLPYIRAESSQSADVTYVACAGFQQRKIERRAIRSWSIVLYQPSNGPFNVINITQTTLTPSAISGNITLTSSRNLFRSTHIGALFRIASVGQDVSIAVNGPSQWSDPIEVTGIGAGRTFAYNISGTFSGTVRIQQSIASPGVWADVSSLSFTSPVSSTFLDGFDNQIIYYRIGIDTGEYTSGTATCQLTFATGSITGIVKVTGYTDQKTVSAEVLKHLGNTSASADWNEGAWSDYRGWPSASTLYEGRLWFAGKSNVWGSESDAYESFDDTVDGDAKTINKILGSGPIDNVNWLLPLQRLLLGTDSLELSARSSSFDDPLTQTNINIKAASTNGSLNIPPVVIDKRGIFVQKGGLAVYQLSLDKSDFISFDYDADRLTLLAPEVTGTGLVRLAVQRQPDTRIHCVRADGQVAIYITDPAEEVSGWVLWQTDGIVEDAFVLPGTQGEDLIYYCVARTINGSTVRCLERFALESECVGGTLNKQADSFLIYSGAPTTTLTAAHLALKSIVVWADGRYNGTYIADASGHITVTPAVSNAVFGLGYQAQYKSVKLAYGADEQEGVASALTQPKRVNSLAVLMHNTHYQGLMYGRTFDASDLYNLPLVEKGTVTPADWIWSSYDAESFEFDGDWNTDSRLCLVANAPLPCTLLGCLVGMASHAKN